MGVKHSGASYRQETISKKFPIEVTHIGVSCRQETVRIKFPIEVTHSGASYRQETIRPEISRLRFVALEMTGGQVLPLVLHAGRKRFDRRFLDSASLRSK